MKFKGLLAGLVLAVVAVVPGSADDLSASLSGGGQGILSLQTSSSAADYSGFVAGIGNIVSIDVMQGNSVFINIAGGSNGGVAVGSANGDFASVNANPGNYSVRVQGTGGTATGDIEFAAEGSGGGGGGPENGLVQGDAGPCRDGAQYACLLDNTFEVRGQLLDINTNQLVDAQFTEFTNETALGFVFSATNIEFLIKMLDQTCEVFGVQWILTGGATDLSGSVTVRDTATGLERVISFARGPFEAFIGNNPETGHVCPEA